MELRQLSYLVALAEEGQFTRAARVVHVAQPSLSQQIAKLEQEVGAQLVERGPRGVSLTEAGAALTIRARRILAEIDAAEVELQGLGELRGGRVTIGAMQTLGPVDLPLLLARFHDSHPAVELSVREDLSENLAGLLRSDQVDLAFLALTERIGAVEDLFTLPMAAERLVAVLPADHRLARRRRLRMAELAEESFVAFRSGASLRHALNTAAGENGFEPRIGFESNEIPRILAMVQRGLGISILPEADARAAGEGVRWAALVDPELSREVTLAWRAGRRLPPAADAFVDLVRSTASGTAA